MSMETFTLVFRKHTLRSLIVKGHYACKSLLNGSEKICIIYLERLIMQI